MDNFRRYPLVERIYTDNNNRNTLILVTPEDEELMKNPDKYFVEGNKFGNGPFYAIDGCSKVWNHADSSLLENSYEWVFDKPKWSEGWSVSDKINAIVNPDAVPKTMPAESPEIINTRYGKFTIIDIPTQRKIIGIGMKNYQ